MLNVLTAILFPLAFSLHISLLKRIIFTFKTIHTLMTTVSRNSRLFTNFNLNIHNTDAYMYVKGTHVAIPIVRETEIEKQERRG